MAGGREVVVLRAPNPGPLTGLGTNTWIYGAGESLVIDPGPADEAHLTQVVKAATRLGPVAAVACTHHHQDHVAGAARLCELTGAPLAVHHRRAQRPGELPLHDQDRLLVGSSELIAVHTPGHASDHLCFFDATERWLFTGDLVLQGTTSLVVPPDGDMTAYLHSLERILRLGPLHLLPGHGEALEDGDAAVRGLIQHRLRREAQILRQLRRGPATVSELVAPLYAAYPHPVLEMAAGTVHTHLIKLEREGLVREMDGDAPARYELTESSS